MAREFAKAFYHSRAWKEARDLCMKAHLGLCARCKKGGVFRTAEIVHHKVHLTPDNIGDPSVSLSLDNLEPLCRECHAAEHAFDDLGGRPPERYAFDENGRLIDAGGTDGGA